MILTNDEGEVTYFAFDKSQTKELAKRIKENNILKKDKNNLEYQVEIDSIKNRQIEQVRDSLFTVIDRFYEIQIKSDSINANNESIIIEQKEIITGLDGKVKRKNKTIKILVGTDILLALFLALLLL